MPDAPLYAYAFVAALVLLAALALHLTRRSPAWRPVAASLAALACIDIARLWTARLGATRAQPWWGLDVALVALWPVALGVGLLKCEGPGAEAPSPWTMAWWLPIVGRPLRPRSSFHVAGQNFEATRPKTRPPSPESTVVDSARLRERPAGREACSTRHGLAQRLALLASLALTLGACRPALPALAYLGALRTLRWGLAGLWAERIVCAALKDERPRLPVAGPPKPSSPAIGPLGRGPLGSGCGATGLRVSPQHASSRRSAQACALVLAGCNVAGLLAGAWFVPPWEPPAWALAGPVTWAAYVVCGVVMGREALRLRAPR